MATTDPVEKAVANICTAISKLAKVKSVTLTTSYINPAVFEGGPGWEEPVSVYDAISKMTLGYMGRTIRFVFKPKGKTTMIHSFRMTQLPGCCGVVVAHQAQTGIEFQREGISRRANLFRQEIARLAGYSLILSTYIDPGVTGKILMEESYDKLITFKNRRTARNIIVASKKITKENS